MYKGLEQVRADCQAGKKANTMSGQNARKASEFAGRVAALKQAFRNYLTSCKPGSDLARELDEMGLSTLLDEGKAAREAWLAKRWSQ